MNPLKGGYLFAEAISARRASEAHQGIVETHQNGAPVLAIRFMSPFGEVIAPHWIANRAAMKKKFAPRLA